VSEGSDMGSDRCGVGARGGDDGASGGWGLAAGDGPAEGSCVGDGDTGAVSGVVDCLCDCWDGVCVGVGSAGVAGAGTGVCRGMDCGGTVLITEV
jgi:hypothetical protein